MGTDAATKTAAQFTPGPWAICSNSFYENLTIVNSAGAEIATCIGDFSKETDEANAALIVRAVNAHDDLLAALKDVLRITKGSVPRRELRQAPRSRRGRHRSSGRKRAMRGHPINPAAIAVDLICDLIMNPPKVEVPKPTRGVTHMAHYSVHHTFEELSLIPGYDGDRRYPGAVLAAGAAEIEAHGPDDWRVAWIGIDAAFGKDPHPIVVPVGSPLFTLIEAAIEREDSDRIGDLIQDQVDMAGDDAEADRGERRYEDAVLERMA